MDIKGCPPTVYLDSSDFSLLSDPRRQSPALERMADQLRSWAAEGRAVFRFSYVHVMEAAPTAKEHIEAAQRRFSLMHELCGAQCLASPYDLLGSEIKRASGRPSNPVVSKDDGHWFPPFDLEFPSLEKMTLTAIHGLPRAQRRVLQKQLFDNVGKLTSDARSSMTTFLPLMVDKVVNEYPLTPEAFAAVKRYFGEGGSKEAMTRGIVDSIANLDAFGKWYSKQWDKTSALASSLREAGQNVKGTLDGLKVRIAEFVTTSGQHLTENDRQILFNKYLPTWTKAMADRLASSWDVHIQSENRPISWELTPSLLTICALFFRVAWLTAALPKESRNPRPSDFGDLAHALYLPHVDVFRADGFVANAIRQAALPWTTTVVAKLDELIDHLEQRLAKTP